VTDPFVAQRLGETVSASMDHLLDAIADRIAERVLARLGPDEPEPDSWMDLSDAAAYLGLHRDTLRKNAKTGGVPYQQDRAGCRLYFRRSDLDHWREQGGAPTTIARLAEIVGRPNREASTRLP
jgi:excisionase family DNA binding protein